MGRIGRAVAAGAIVASGLVGAVSTPAPAGAAEGIDRLIAVSVAKSEEANQAVTPGAATRPANASGAPAHSGRVRR